MGWDSDALGKELDRLARHGYQPDNSDEKRRVYVALPNVHRIRRRLVDGLFHEHYRHRKTCEKLPDKWGSPEFMIALIECERRLALQQAPSARTKLETLNSPPVQPQLKKRKTRSERVALAQQTAVEGNKLHSAPIYLTPEEISERWRGKITPETLANWRALQIGPPYSKFGKAVLYRIDLLDKWEQKNLVLCGATISTSVNERDN